MSTRLDPRYAIQAFAHRNAFNPATQDGAFMTTPTDGETHGTYDHLTVTAWPGQVATETKLRNGYAVLAIGDWPRNVQLFVDDVETARRLLESAAAIYAHLSAPKAE